MNTFNPIICIFSRKVVVMVHCYVWINRRQTILLCCSKIQRTYNDKADSYPQHAGKFLNFRIFIEFFIHEVKNRTVEPTPWQRGITDQIWPVQTGSEQNAPFKTTI